MSKLTSSDLYDQLCQVHEALAELKQMALPGKAGRLVHVAELWQMQAIEDLALQRVTVTPATRDLDLVAEITELRKQDSTAQPSLEHLRAIDRVLVEQARERLGLPEHKK